MNRKISRNEKQKYSNEERLSFVEIKNTSALINIAHEDGSNIFELLQNLGINSLQFIILKCSRLCLIVTFDFILLLLYKQMFCSFMVRKQKGKSNLSKILFKIFSFLQPPYSPIPQLLVFDIFSNHPYYSTPPSIKDLRVGMILLHV